MTDLLPDLAAAHGVATSYADWSGTVVPVSTEAVVAALAALGVAADDDDAVAAALEEVQAAPWRRILPPSVVVRAPGVGLALHVPQDSEVVLRVLLEDGGAVEVPVASGAQQRREGRESRRAVLPDLPLGWHRLVADAGGETDEAVLVVAPATIAPVPGRSWGWMVQLYSLRSADSWGLGDYRDLRTVVEQTAADGAGAILLNPLHAETPVLPVNPSPYSPSSRRFRSPLSLRIADVAEFADAPDDVVRQVQALRPVDDPERIDRDPALAAKIAALELLWPHHRAPELAAFRAERGPGLEDFALFFSLAEVHGAPWQQWPQDLRRPDGPGVEQARARHADRVAFWCWVQLLVDEQLSAVQDAASSMAVGVIHDLAVGVDAGGADAWALQDALALDTTVGAPPDSFNQQGQDWGLPPWRPDRLREQGYAPYRDLVRGVLRHAGGLRIDHVMGLFRLWWVPAGAAPPRAPTSPTTPTPCSGCSRWRRSGPGSWSWGRTSGRWRTGCGPPGEHRGARQRRALVQPGRATDRARAFLPPATWPEAALASVTTHDLPTAAGFLAEEHVRVRDELGQLGVPVEQERERVREERAALLLMLQEQGLLQACDGDVVLAMHAALAASPCRIVLAALGDAVGDLRQPNLPGTVDEYPNWRLPVADAEGRPLGLSELLASDGVRRLTALLREGVR